MIQIKKIFFFTTILLFISFLLLPQVAYAAPPTFSSQSSCRITGTAAANKQIDFWLLDAQNGVDPLVTADTWLGSVNSNASGNFTYNLVNMDPAGQLLYYNGRAHVISASENPYSGWRNGSSLTSAQIGCDANSPTGTFDSAPNFCNANWTGTATDADSPSSSIQVDFWLLYNDMGFSGADNSVNLARKGHSYAVYLGNALTDAAHNFSFNPRTQIADINWYDAEANATYNAYNTFFSIPGNPYSWNVSAFALNKDINGTDRGGIRGSLHRYLPFYKSLTCNRNIVASCTANPSSATSNSQLVTWRESAPSDISAISTINWSGSAVIANFAFSNSNPASATYTSEGTYNARGDWTSGDGQSGNSTCSFTLTAPAPIATSVPTATLVPTATPIPPSISGSTGLKIKENGADPTPGVAAGTYGTSGLRSSQGGQNYYNSLQITQTITNGTASNVNLMGVAFVEQGLTLAGANLTTLINSANASGVNGFVMVYAQCGNNPTCTVAGRTWTKGNFYVYFGRSWSSARTGKSNPYDNSSQGLKVDVDNTPGFPPDPIFAVTLYNTIGNHTWGNYAYLMDNTGAETVTAKTPSSSALPLASFISSYFHKALSSLF